MANTKVSTVPPPDQQPEFILDLFKWTIRRFKACEQEIQHKFETRREWRTSKDKGYPQFDIGMKSDKPNEKLEWVFPFVRKLNKDNQTNTTEPEIFTIFDVKQVFETLGLRFIWWDWACIPQGWSEAFDKTKTPEAELHKDLKGVNWIEMNKMRYVYPRSSKGTLWFHQSTWTGPKNTVKGPVQKAVEICNKLRATKGPDRTVEDIKAAVDAIEATRATEASLVSLWSFQEGVLFGSPERPQQTSSGPLDKSVLLDHNGTRLPTDGSLTGQADLIDLVELTSAVAGTIALIQRIKVENPSYAASQGITKVIEPWSTDGLKATLAKWFGAPSLFTGWCFDPKNDAEAKKLLMRLIGTGLANYTYNSPLSLREAIMGRIPNAYSGALDIDVMTLLGAVDVDIKDDIKAAESLQQPAKDQTIRKAFLRKLVDTYQWRMLYSAVERRIWAADMKAFWPTLVDTDKFKRRPQFAALDTHVGSAYLQSLYGPRRPNPPAFPKDQPALPELEVAHSDTQEILVKPRPGYKFYNLKTPPPPAKPDPVYSSCTFYGLDPTSFSNKSPEGNPMPNLVQYLKLGPSDWRPLFGDKVLLLPIQYLPDTDLPFPLAPRTRCVVVRDWQAVRGPTPLAGAASLGDPVEVSEIERVGVFAGIADIEGLSDKYKTDELTGDLALF